MFAIRVVAMPLAVPGTSFFRHGDLWKHNATSNVTRLSFFEIAMSEGLG